MFHGNHQAMIDECLNARDVLEELVSNEEFLKKKSEESCKILVLNLREHLCLRCDHSTKTTSKFPYCSECNWDYQHDSKQTNIVAKAA
jgi:hypothetical protein